jgi:hypothetical protein
MLWKWCKKEVVSDGSGSYLRLRATDLSYAGLYKVLIYEAEFFESSDLSGTKIPVSSASASRVTPPHYTENAIDDDLTTFWLSLSGTRPQWWRAYFGSAVTVGSFRLYLNPTNHHPREMVVEVSDTALDSDWVPIKTIYLPEITSGLDEWVNFLNIQG